MDPLFIDQLQKEAVAVLLFQFSADMILLKILKIPLSVLFVHETFCDLPDLIYENAFVQYILPAFLLDLHQMVFSGLQIDITDEGSVSICGVDQHGMDEAKKMIKTIATDFEAGQIFEGTVVSIKEFGAFVEFAPGKEGMVHISKISDHRINKVEDVLTLGDKVKVICLGKDKMGRMSFSIKDVPEEA